MNTQTKSQKTLIILFAAFAMPLILAIALYLNPNAWEIKTKNYGTLISPPLPLSHLTNQLKLSTPPWYLGYKLPSPCELDCQQVLDKLKSVQLALGKDTNGVHRLIVAEGQHPSLKHFQALAHQDSRLNILSLSDLGELRNFDLFIIDPNGQLILSYPTFAESSGLLRDIKLLTKASSHG